MPSQPGADPEYHAFLLRLWRSATDPRWHCSLQTASGSERRGFADLHQLLSFLLQLTEPPPPDVAVEREPE